MPISISNPLKRSTHSRRESTQSHSASSAHGIALDSFIQIQGRSPYLSEDYVEVKSSTESEEYSDEGKGKTKRKERK